MARSRITPASHAVLSYFPEAATQTFKRGAVLVNSSGFIAGGGADPTDVLGIAAEDGHNDTTAGTHQLAYYRIEPGSLWAINIDDSGDLGNGALVDADFNTRYGLAVSADVWYVDKADTTNTLVVVRRAVEHGVQIAANAATVRKQARVLVEWLNSALHGDA